MFFVLENKNKQGKGEGVIESCFTCCLFLVTGYFDTLELLRSLSNQ